MSRFLLCILSEFLFLSISFGQSAAKVPAEADLKAQQLNRKAQILLTETLQQTRLLKNKENQVLARIDLAELLWKDQEAVARRLYHEAMDIIRQARNEIDESDAESFESNGSVLRLRDRVLQSLGQHDPVLAKELLRQTKIVGHLDAANAQTASGETSEPQSDQVDADTSLELTLAIEGMDKNPDEAVRIARKALTQRYPNELVPLLVKLEEKNPAQAGELAVEVANKLRKADFDSEPQAIGLVFFFLDDAISSIKPDKTTEDKDEQEKRAPLLTPQFAREFLEFISEAAVKKETGSYLLFNLRSRVDDIEAVASAPGARLKKGLAEFDKENEELGSYARLEQLSRTNDVDAMLEMARTAPAAMRENYYGDAASMAWEKGDESLAKEIVSKYISNDYERNRLLVSFQDQTIARLIAKADFNQAQQLIAKIRPGRRRIGYLLDLATALSRKNDKKGALEILTAAQNLIPEKATNSDEFDVQLRLAGAFSELDSDRSFALYTSAIDQINELMEATAKVASFAHMPISIKDNEFSIESHTAVPGLGLLFSGDIRTLAQADFERTKSMFEKFQRPEIRIVAYLSIAKAILEPPPDCTCSCPEPAKKETKAVSK